MKASNTTRKRLRWARFRSQSAKILISLILLVGIALPVLASDISSAEFFGTIEITNNSTGDAGNVATVVSLNSTQLIADDYMNATANDTVIRNSSGADVSFMPGYAGNPWPIWVPNINALSLRSYILYTNATGGDIVYFPGAEGMTTPDSASLELGDNFTIEQSGWIDTDNGIDKNLVNKLRAFRLYVDTMTSGTVKASIHDENWAGRTSASARVWRAIAWSPELSLFAAVAGDGVVATQVMTSPDGITWTSQTSASAQQWFGIDWSPELGLFAAVALDGAVGVQVMTSPDGITWTSRTSASSQFWLDIIWAPDLSLFVAVAQNGVADNQVMTSPDGIAWTSRTSASARQWQDIIWAPDLSLFVAVALDGPANLQVMTSPDGLAWTSRTSASARQWTDVTWSPELGLFTAVALDGAVGVQVMTSPDGIAWTSRTSASAQQWVSIDWSPELGLFAAVALDGAVGVQIMDSFDGITWATETSPAAQSWGTVVWSPELGLFAAVANDGGVGVQVMTSGTKIVTATGVASGEHILNVTADSVNLTISIDGVPQDTTALDGVSVLDTSDNWGFLLNSVMPYMKSHQITIDGVSRQEIEWQYSDNFSDGSGNGHYAIPTFRTTSSDSDVSANLTSFLPVAEAKAPSAVITDAPDFITVAPVVTGNFTSSINATLPGSDVINEAATAGETPSQLPYLVIAGFGILSMSLTTSWAMKSMGSSGKEVVIKGTVVFLLMSVLVPLRIIDFWMLMFFGILAIAIALASRRG